MNYIQYGCGLSAPKGWVNFDASPTVFIERLPFIGGVIAKKGVGFPENVLYGDICKGRPIADSSCKGMYCSHVLEHLSLTDFRIALRNTYKLLEVGGVFRLVLPDLEYSINKYVNNKSNEAALTFLKETGLGREVRNKGLEGFVRGWLGNSEHLWMWDYKSIEHELLLLGFKEIKRVEFGDSSDVRFQEVEVLERWQNCLGVECKK